MKGDERLASRRVRRNNRREPNATHVESIFIAHGLGSTIINVHRPFRQTVFLFQRAVHEE